VNIHPTVISALRSLMRVAVLGASLALAACGTNWQDAPAYVKVGGIVSGLTGTLVLCQGSACSSTPPGGDPLTVTSNGPFSFALKVANGSNYVVTVRQQPQNQTCTIANASGGTNEHTSVTVTCLSNATIGGTISGLSGAIVLQNNGGDALATATNGPFTFTQSIANGTAYSVTVRTQPPGQYCTVSNGSGTATTNVVNVAVACKTVTAGLRALPSIYATGKAINYSAYRTAGPGSEVPTDAQVLEDLRLLHAAGYNLLRLFAADVVSTKVLRLALANYPDMQFHLGAYIFGINAPGGAACDSNPQNTDPVTGQLAQVVLLANTYPNVATVSVGNETSFFRTYMPVSCLAGYIQTVRSQVAQPVTADDDYTFYCSAAPECSPAGSADPILAIVDFVSIHTYPMSNPGRWDWVQAGTAAGPARAKAMMEASLAEAKAMFGSVASKTYVNAAGTTVSIAASLPIVIGETGWKARQTNHSATAYGLIEQYAATPMNAKWYYDLLYGSAPGAANVYPAWQGSAGGPLAIFYFEAFDEVWKGEGTVASPATDDGWGLWGGTDPTVAGYGDAIRLQPPRYALCGYYASFSFSGVTYPAAPACNNPETYPGAGFHP
jgi:exo-beta-1,3-glucanase (GH17 family)